MVKNYGSDVGREQFEIIREDLEKAKKATRPRKVDLCDVFCAVLYVLKTGCQFEEILKKLVRKVRIAKGRKAKASFVITLKV